MARASWVVAGVAFNEPVVTKIRLGVTGRASRPVKHETLLVVCVGHCDRKAVPFHLGIADRIDAEPVDRRRVTPPGFDITNNTVDSRSTHSEAESERSFRPDREHHYRDHQGKVKPARPSSDRDAEAQLKQLSDEFADPEERKAKPDDDQDDSGPSVREGRTHIDPGEDEQECDCGKAPPAWRSIPRGRYPLSLGVRRVVHPEHPNRLSDAGLDRPGLPRTWKDPLSAASFRI